MKTSRNKSPLTYLQDSVMDDYLRSPAIRKLQKENPKNRPERALHMFFSPHRVPVGLTDNEVAICIRLHPYREQMVEKHNAIEDAKLKDCSSTPYPFPTLDDAMGLVEAGVHSTLMEAQEHLEHLWQMGEHIRHHPFRFSPSLPPELSPLTVMTRERFRQGVRAFIAQYRKMFPPPQT